MSYLLVLLILVMAAPVFAQTPTGNEEAICTNSSVVFCENWEDRPLGWPPGAVLGSQYKNTGWILSTPQGGSVVTTEHNDGTRSLQVTTPANQSSGGESDTINNTWANLTDFYWRSYEKYSPNYVWSPVGTKNWEQLHVGQSQDIDYFNGSFNSTRINLPDPVIIAFLSNDPRGENCGPPCKRFHQNGTSGSITFVPGRWYCLEVHLKYNTGSNSFDGTLEAWVDGIQYWNYPNAHISTTANDNMQGIEYITYWNCGGPGGDQCHGPQSPDFLDFTHPDISRYIDNIIVAKGATMSGGRSAPIGCIGAVVTAPGTPANLTVTTP